MIESGLSNFALTNAAISQFLGQSAEEKTKNDFSTTGFCNAIICNERK